SARARLVGEPRTSGGTSQPRLQRPAEHRHAVDVPQIDGHVGGLRVDVHFTEELKAAERRQVRLPWRRRLAEHDLWSERAVERVWPEGAGVERSGDEFPEAVEVVERGAGRIVEMRGAVVDVSGQPHDVAHALTLQETEQLGEFQFAALRRSWFAVGDGFP